MLKLPVAVVCFNRAAFQTTAITITFYFRRRIYASFCVSNFVFMFPRCVLPPMTLKIFLPLPPVRRLW